MGCDDHLSPPGTRALATDEPIEKRSRTAGARIAARVSGRRRPASSTGSENHPLHRLSSLHDDQAETRPTSA